MVLSEQSSITSKTEKNRKLFVRVKQENQIRIFFLFLNCNLYVLCRSKEDKAIAALQEEDEEVEKEEVVEEEEEAEKGIFLETKL